MQSTKILLRILLGLLLPACRPLFGADSVTISNVYSEIHGLSGNITIPGIWCGSQLVTYDYSFAGKETSHFLQGCCGSWWDWITPSLTNNVAGEEALVSSLRLTVQGELCSAGGPIVWGVPGCFAQDIHQTAGIYDWTQSQGRPSYVSWIIYLRRNTNSIPLAKWDLKDMEGKPIEGEPSEGFYHLPADGMATAQAVILTNIGETVTWAFKGEPIGCTLTPEGLLTVGTNQGTIQVAAQIMNTDPCLQRDFYFDLGPACEECIKACKLKTKMKSVDITINLGPSLKTPNSAYLVIKSATPTLDLGNPSLLRCDYVRPDLEKLTNSAGWLRQVRALENIVDILTNSASSYSLNFYYPANVASKTNDLYQFTGSPYQSITIQLVGGDTNQVRVTDSGDGASTDYLWEGTGWAMVTGNGLRREAKTVSLSGGIRTDSTTIKNAGGVVEY